MKRLSAALAFAAGLQAACSVPAQPSKPHPVSYADSTFRLDVRLTVATPTPVVATIMGTAWYAKRSFDEPVVITAGHMCPDTIEGFPVLSKEFRLVGQNGFHASALGREKADYADLCALTVVGDLPDDANPLPLAKQEPEYGDEVFYVGAPDGIYGDGLAPYYTGHYAGGNLITAPTAGGASGSAVWTDRGVVGVLVAVERRFANETFIVRLPDLRAFEEAQ